MKVDWNFLLHILAFSFISVLRIPFSLSDAIPNAPFLRDLTNDQNFLLSFQALEYRDVLKRKYIANVFP